MHRGARRKAFELLSDPSDPLRLRLKLPLFVMLVCLSSCSKRGDIGPWHLGGPRIWPRFPGYPSSRLYACAWVVKDIFRYPTPPFLSRDWPLKSLTRLIGPTYSTVIPYLIYSFQLFIGSSVITLTLHLVKLPLQGYRYPIRPMSLYTKPPRPPYAREQQPGAPRCESGAPSHAMVWRIFTGRIGEANEHVSYLQPSVEQITSRIGKISIAMLPITRSRTLKYTSTIRYAYR